jgi:nucleoside-diphosphate-sugar epimerase
MALEASLNGSAFTALNFAPLEESLSVRDVAKIAENTWGESGNIEFATSDNLLESEKLDLDPTKAGKSLGWSPAWTQPEAIKSSIQWWKNLYGGKYSALDLCEADLQHLMKN